MLIGNNIINLKQIDIINIKKKARIKSYNTEMPIRILIKPGRTRPVYLIKGIYILLYIIVRLPIYYINLLDYNFFFELNKQRIISLFTFITDKRTK